MSDGKNVSLVDPSSGVVKDYSPEEAQAIFTGGQANLLPGDSVPLVHADGTVGDFPSANVEKALAAGWSFANRGQVLQADAPNQRLQAFAEGALGGLTFDAVPAALAGMGVEGVQERANTTAGHIGQAVGMTGQLFIPVAGEFGAAAAAEHAAASGIMRNALQAAMAPQIAATMAGQAIEKAGAKALGEIVSGDVARATAASLLGHGVEGAAVGAIQSISEESLGDPNANAETLLAAGGMGALIGGGLGAVVGGGVTGISELRAARKARVASLTAEQLGDHLAAQGIDAARDNPLVTRALKVLREDAPANLMGFDRDAIRTVNAPENRAWIRDIDTAREEGAAALRDVVDRMAHEQGQAGAAIEQLRPGVARELASTVGGNVAVGHVAEQFDTAYTMLDQLESRFGELGAGDPTKLKLLKGYRQALDGAKKKIFDAAGVAETYEERVVRESFPTTPYGQGSTAPVQVKTTGGGNAELPFFADDAAAAHWLDAPQLNQIAERVNGARGASESFVVHFQTPDGVKRAIYKPDSGAFATPELAIAPESVSQREVAAYEIARAINPQSPVVPKTVSRNGGSYQEMVDHEGTALEHTPRINLDPAKFAGAPTVQETFLLDLVTRNPDRHGGNLLLRDVEGATPKGVAIDNGLGLGKVVDKSDDLGLRTPWEPEYAGGTFGSGNFGAATSKPNVFNDAIREAPEALRAKLDRTSAKQIADALRPLDKIPLEQKIDVLGRLQDLKLRPGQLKDMDDVQLREWLAKSLKERQLSDVDIHHIETLMGANPSGAFTKATPTRLPGKALEGEQLGLDLSRSVQEPVGTEAARAAERAHMGSLVGTSTTETTVKTRTLADLVEKYELPGKTSGAAFDALNTLRVVTDRATKAARLPEMQEMFKSLANDVSKGLENEMVWGKAGRMQGDLNHAIAARESAWADLQKQIKFLGPDQVDPAAMASFAKNLQRLKGDATVDAIDRWHSAQQMVADVAEKHFAGARDFANRNQALTRDFQRARIDLDKRVAVGNALESLRAHHARGTNNLAQGGLNYGAGALGIAAGHALLGGGPLAAIGGMVAGSKIAAGIINVTDPARAAVMRANSAGMRTRVGEATQAYAKVLVNAVGRVVPPKVNVPRVVSGATTRMLEAKSAKEREEAYKERKAELASLGDPETLAGHIDHRLGDISQHMPAHARAMNDQAAQAYAYLTQSLPVARSTMNPTGSFGRPAPTPSQQSIIEFALRDQVAQHPFSVFEQAMKRGYVLPAQLQTLRALYPKLADAMGTAVAEHLDARREPVSDAHSRLLAGFLGELQPLAYLPGAQAVHAQEDALKSPGAMAPPKPPGPAARPRPGPGQASATDALDRK
jgi:hypothetical protein